MVRFAFLQWAEDCKIRSFPVCDLTEAPLCNGQRIVRFDRVGSIEGFLVFSRDTVSYTHLDVYKRQLVLLLRITETDLGPIIFPARGISLFPSRSGGRGGTRAGIRRSSPIARGEAATSCAAGVSHGLKEGEGREAKEAAEMAETMPTELKVPLSAVAGAPSEALTSYVVIEERDGGGGAGDLHDGLSFPQYMLAGSFAGLVEHTAMFPVDTIKTRMQALVGRANAMSPHHDTTVLKAVSSILRSEGPLGLYRGIGAMCLGAGPAHAVYFATYEFAKQELGGNRSGHHPVAHATAGALATVASDAVFTPMDVVKQRMQLRNSPYRGVMDTVRRIAGEEGLGAFYASYRTTLVMNVPFTAVHFATYEGAKRILRDTGLGHVGGGGEKGEEGEGGEENLSTHLTAGGAAGALASAVTNPLDVIKTRLQTQGVNGAQRFSSGSVVAAMRTIVREEGLSALARGTRPRVLFHTPAAAICWATYEASKKFLQRWNDDHPQ
ncbi:hypothetical protein CBR_g910 [Chara braunii]|uniref:Uncharacterized protein n=1 Tax=Chara braunii TaxID=69332 RepID=A0A388KCK4_CHABU|nr:hypothetical protein CBR_g910 [Chara braunii]|eukprot:GBG67785.1 hypothetical protein CBR_g910 [Chara braunii]